MDPGLLGKTQSDRDLYPSAAKGPYLGRQNSASETKWSHSILYVLETGTVDQVREELNDGLLNCPDSLISQSIKKEHALRTPLMAAAASGDFAMFTSVKHAVDRAIRVQATLHVPVLELNRRQLEAKDQWGQTLAMLAAGSGTVSIMKDVLERISHAEDQDRLLDSDYRGKTVLMHAAGAGRSALFDAVFGAIRTTLSDSEVENQLLLKSGTDRNLIMLAARGGDQMGVTAVVNACKERLFPSKVRALVEDTDGEGMTFLMHAASGTVNDCTNADHRATGNQPQARFQPQNPRSKSAAADDMDFSYFSHTGRQGHPLNRLPSVYEESKLGLGAAESPTAGQGGDGGGVGSATADLPAASDDQLGDAPGRLASNATRPTVSQALQGGDEVDDPTVTTLRRAKGMMYPSLVVFKAAWCVVEEVLWKEQIREQLRKKDSWGRTILTHAVLSGRVQVFEAALCAMRDHILDTETEVLLGVNKEDNNQSIMEAALDLASKEMGTIVALRDQQLKKSIAEDEKASTIEAKIQSFIPGKLIVIFQLLLPQMGAGDGIHNGAFILLLVLTFIAPSLSWASHLVSREKVTLAKDLRHSMLTNLLSAPAIFFWGVATSDIGEDSLDWSKSTSAAALAVATIVIPGLDAFFANRIVEQWLDKWSCRKYRFASKAHAAWHKEHKKRQDRSKPTPAAKSSSLKKELAPAALTRYRYSPPPHPGDGNDQTTVAAGGKDTQILEESKNFEV